MSEQIFYIASLKHTSRDSEHITWWRPNHRGYTPVVERAGQYTREEAERLNDGCDHIAVPVESASALTSPTPYYRNRLGTAIQFYDHAGPVVDNTRKNWNRLIALSLPGQVHKPKPEVHRRARRSFALPEAAELGRSQ